jgi:hypothetical protein
MTNYRGQMPTRNQRLNVKNQNDKSKCKNVVRGSCTPNRFSGRRVSLVRGWGCCAMTNYRGQMPTRNQRLNVKNQNDKSKCKNVVRGSCTPNRFSGRRVSLLRGWGCCAVANEKAQMTNEVQSTNAQGFITPLAPLTLRGGFRGCHAMTWVKEGNNHPHLNPLPSRERRLAVLLVKDTQ